MTKHELVNRIAKRTNLDVQDVSVMLEALMRETKWELLNGGSVILRGFGTFYPLKRARKVGRIITRGESIVIPEHFIPRFKAAKKFRSDMKKVVGERRDAGAQREEEV